MLRRVNAMTAPRHADKVGVAGAAFAAFCCLGITAVVSVVSALGLSFLLNDAVLAPLLILSLALTLWGLASGWRRHRNVLPLAIGSAAGLALFVTSFLAPLKAAAYASIGALVLASILNVLLLRRRMHGSS